MPFELHAMVSDIADAVASLDASGVAFKEFRPGAGPYGEPQLVREIAQRLRESPKYRGAVQTKRLPIFLFLINGR